ncbi:Rne/Rng family ribonuclease [Neobacillus dielmonensis]|uniref:Rne/Rng family ribonuclease n=1 Tax=Neobacillus dielmonensis TaxID=1347369 RepID=UPI0005A71B11|nr:Rne/Rng family ribonuclease [Neobacillus dielmonensis]
METLIINYKSREKRFAYLRDNSIEKIMIDRPEQHSLVGNIYYGTITKVLPGMNAVFVNIGEDKNAYLHRNELPAYLFSADKQKNITSFAHQGEKLLVQVNKDATGTKGPRVTGIIEIQGNNLIYLPNGQYISVSKKIADEQQKARFRKLGSRLTTKEEGLIFRTSSINSTEEEIQQEFDSLRDKYHEMQTKAASLTKPGILYQQDTFLELVANQAVRMKNGEIVVDDLEIKKWLEQKHLTAAVTFYNGKENIFSAHTVEQKLEKALKRIVWLDNGSYLIFDETEALTIIDVNTGKFSGKADYRDTVFKTNLLAAKEIMHQLRLRDIGGIVVIDFIDMSREQDKQAILDIMKQEIDRDDKRTKLIGFTPLGILQLTRKKTKVTLSEALQIKCPTCDGTGRILSPETVAFRLERELLEHRMSDDEAVWIETTPDVKTALLGPEEEHRGLLEQMVQLKLYFSLQHSVEPYYVLKQFGDGDEIAQKAVESY